MRGIAVSSAGAKNAVALATKKLMRNTSGTMALIGISAATGVAAVMVNPNAVPEPSNGFWTDIIGGEDQGATLHRIQLIAWTILLGGIFAWTVLWTFALPDFDTNLLLLAGIAGGTYLGFKAKES